MNFLWMSPSFFYILTAKGIETKARISVRFLQRKIKEYESLSQEIEQLKEELNVNAPGKHQ